MVEYVIEKYNETLMDTCVSTSEFSECYVYAKLLNRLPELGQFVPCNEKGEVIKGKPISSINKYAEWDTWERRKEEYHAAQERVIFKGWEAVKKRLPHPNTHVKLGKLDFKFDKYGLFIEPYDSVDGERVSTLNDIAHLRLEMK